jgi:phosphatidylglycerol:prolipoprotein diacylglycerol transferase
VYPVLIQWGDLLLPAWHTFYVLGALAALALFLRLGRLHEPNVARSDLARIFAIGYALGWFGARALSIPIEQRDVSGVGPFFTALVTFGPMTFYGGAIAAFAGCSAYVLWRRLPFARLCDLALPPGLLALAIGRVGCFLNGDDYGKAAPLAADGSAPWWAVTFPNLADGIPRWPVQLLEAGLVFLLVAVLWRFFLRIRLAFRPGMIALLAIVGYANLRFLLEFLRDDFRGAPFGNWLSTSQFLSLMILLACGLTTPYWLRTTPRA